MDMVKLLTGGALAGTIVACWESVKRAVSLIIGVFIKHIQLDYTSSKLGCFIGKYLTELGYKNLTYDKDTYWFERFYVNSLKHSKFIAIRRGRLEGFWIKGWRVVYLNKDNNKLSYIRGTIDPNKVLQELMDKFNELLMGSVKDKTKDNYSRFTVRLLSAKSNNYPPRAANDRKSEEDESINKVLNHLNLDFNFTNDDVLKYNKEEIGYVNNKYPFSCLYYNQEVMDIVNDADIWLNSKEWFQERSIPWKRGYLLTSRPGCGKTAFVHSLGQKLGIPVFSIDLSAMSNNDLDEAWQEVIDNSPCIALFEDIDAVFDGRKNVSNATHTKQALSYDFFLNILDGIRKNDGILTIITTNNMDKIDAALGGRNGHGLSTRPGRIDKIVEFSYLSNEHKLKMAERILDKFSRELWEDVLDYNGDYTGAQYQEKCCRKALELFWKQKGGSK